MSDDLTECDECGNLYDTFVNDRCPECRQDADALAFDTPDAHGSVQWGGRGA